MNLKIKKVIGIVSWFPNSLPDRQLRINRLELLLTHLNKIWPDIPIMIIAQNWLGYQIKSIPLEKLIINRYIELGILGARKKLRKKFLESEFDYIIMFDDDALIWYESDDLPIKYMLEVDNHPNGFCFIKTPHSSSPYNPYADSQLNLCAISRFIYEKEDMPNVDPQLSLGFEDKIFSYLLHIKYSLYEFDAPNGIKCNHFKNKEAPLPSTWARRKRYDWKHMVEETKRIEKYILDNKDLPPILKGKLK